MTRWFDPDDLGAVLDRASPLDMLGCIAGWTEDEDGLHLIWQHPDWLNVFCKFGQGKPRPDGSIKWIKAWFWIELYPDGRDKAVHILTAALLTLREITYLREHAPI